MTGIELINKERKEQLNKHGYSVENDLKYDSYELLLLTEFVIKSNDDAEKWNLEELLLTYGFSKEFLTKLSSKSDIESLSITGALLAAEIDRILLMNK